MEAILILTMLALGLLTPTCATTHPFDPGTSSCASDADCVVTQFVACCACAGEPRAGNRASVERDWEACLAAGCKALGDEQGNCPRVARASAFRAICSHGLCEAVER